ncbi:MAG TPA: hypothetical protein VM282_18990 [Acidimicrobiales bacterium]|nr:hypothetical protein [Acidimicrobiales bacterium]
MSRLLPPKVLARRWWILGGVAAGIFLVDLRISHATAWHYFADASDLLFGWTREDLSGPGGLQIFASHPEFQFGPPAIVAATPLVRLGPTIGPVAAMIAMSVLGLVALRMVERTAFVATPSTAREIHTTTLVGGVLVVSLFSTVACRTGHFDDVLALTATAVALYAVATNRRWIPAVVIGLAAATKPWAIGFAPLCAVPGPYRLRRLVVFGACAALPWLSFLLAEPDTFRALSEFKIANAPESALRRLGVSSEHTPSWARIAQITLGTLGASFAVHRHNWAAVPLVAIAVRLALDPEVHHYYTAGLVLAAFVWDLHTRPGRIPYATIAAATLEVVRPPLVSDSISGGWRLTITVGAVVYAFAARQAHPNASAAWVRGRC